MFQTPRSHERLSYESYLTGNNIQAIGDVSHAAFRPANERRGRWPLLCEENLPRFWRADNQARTFVLLNISGSRLNSSNSECIFGVLVLTSRIPSELPRYSFPVSSFYRKRKKIVNTDCCSRSDHSYSNLQTQPIGKIFDFSSERHTTFFSQEDETGARVVLQS